MQKFINVIAVSSGIVSLAIVVGGVSVYVSRDAILDGIKSQIMESVTGSIPGIIYFFLVVFPTWFCDVWNRAKKDWPCSGDQSAKSGIWSVFPGMF